MLLYTLEVSFLSLIPSPSQLSAFMLFSPDELDTEKDTWWKHTDLTIQSKR